MTFKVWSHETDLSFVANVIIVSFRAHWHGQQVVSRCFARYNNVWFFSAIPWLCGPLRTADTPAYVQRTSSHPNDPRRLPTVWLRFKHCRQMAARSAEATDRSSSCPPDGTGCHPSTGLNWCSYDDFSTFHAALVEAVDLKAPVARRPHIQRSAERVSVAENDDDDAERRQDALAIQTTKLSLEDVRCRRYCRRSSLVLDISNIMPVDATALWLRPLIPMLRLIA